MGIFLFLFSFATEGHAQGILGALTCNPSPSVLQGFEKAKALAGKCKGPGGEGGPKIAVTDYTANPVQMWVFDQSGKCIETHGFITWGSNSGVPPKPGCRNGSHMTPAGGHCTAVPGVGAKYNPSNSLLMKSLESQNSEGRGILIHSNKGKRNSPSTWGCTGCDYPKVRKSLGVGSVLYNWFGGQVGDCSGVDKGATANSKTSKTTAGRQ